MCFIIYDVANQSAYSIASEAGTPFDCNHFIISFFNTPSFPIGLLTAFTSLVIFSHTSFCILSIVVSAILCLVVGVLPLTDCDFCILYSSTAFFALSIIFFTKSGDSISIFASATSLTQSTIMLLHAALIAAAASHQKLSTKNLLIFFESFMNAGFRYVARAILNQKSAGTFIHQSFIA